MIKQNLLISILILGVTLPTTKATEIHISPLGKDDNPGTMEKPLKTFDSAQQMVRQSVGKKPISVIFHEGVYYLPATIRFTSEDSGTKDAPVIYRVLEEGKAIISGGSRLNLTWTVFKNGIYKAKVPDDLSMDQLFINGERQHMARYPNFNPDILVFDGYDKDCYAPPRASRWVDPTGGYIHAMHIHRWGDIHYRITGKDADNKVSFEGGWQNNRPYGMHKEHRFVENIFEELDAPGEWFHNSKTNTLFFYPPEGINLHKARVEVVRLAHLIEFNGSEKKPVKFISMEGFTFRHTARTFMENKEPLLRSDWTTYRGGAILFNGAEDCVIADCEFDQLGGNTIFVSKYNRRITIRGCYIHDSGASGVAFVGDPDAVRSPLFYYGDEFDYETIDRTPGPKTNNYPADCLVEDCLITRTGRVEKQTAPVQISMSQSITVRHCSIYDVPRAGINISEGTWGGHLIEFCDVFDTVLETGDHGSFNSWGRDRFWHPNPRIVDKEVAASPVLPFLDARKKTILRNNRWRCDHGWDIDLDDGSTNYEIYNNLMLRGGLKLREGYKRIVKNNIIINNALHPHVWYENSGDVFKNNIVMTAYRPAGMSIKKWGELIDYNLFTSNDWDRTRFVKYGCDENSLVDNPMFVYPENGDFRVYDGSSALQLGFKKFPMDQYGVQKPSLKAIARTPEIPKIGSLVKTEVAHDEPFIWGDMVIRNIVSEEYSAFGVSKEQGGIVVLKLLKSSELANSGLKKGDLIQGVAGKAASSIEDFIKILQSVKAASDLELSVRRHQKNIIFDIKRPKDLPVITTLAFPDGSLSLLPDAALLSGDLRIQAKGEKTNIGQWQNSADFITWQVVIPQEGQYKLGLSYSKPEGDVNVGLTLGAEKIESKISATGSWEKFLTSELGQINIPSPGIYTITLSPAQVWAWSPINVREISMEPVQ